MNNFGQLAELIIPPATSTSRDPPNLSPEVKQLDNYTGLTRKAEKANTSSETRAQPASAIGGARRGAGTGWDGGSCSR